MEQKKTEATSATFWQAASVFRTSNDAEEKHQARVTLLRLAIYDQGSVGERAQELLRTEGLIIARAAVPTLQVG